MDDIIIRDATINDIPDISNNAVKSIRSSLSKIYSPQGVELLAQYYSIQSLEDAFKIKKFFVAEVMGKIVGSVGLRLENGLITALYIDPDYMKRGIGEKLLEKIETFGKSNNYKEVSLNSTLNAVGFYLKKGYEEVEEVKIDHDVVFIKMKKTL